MNTNNNHKVLVIDDDPTLRMIAKVKLVQYGYQVFTAGNGEEGVQAAIDYIPDIILLDYELPDMTGVDVCRSIRNHALNIDKPILFIAGKEDYLSIENAFLAGATDFSRKPLNWTILNYRIQYLLHAHKLYLSLLASEDRLTKAQKIAKIANWDYSSESKIFQWSDTIYDILEKDSDCDKNIHFQKFLERIPDSEVDFVKKAMDDCVNNHISFQLEHTLLTDKGSQKIIHHLGNVIKNDANQVVDCIGTLQDITERRHAENKIRSLAYFDSLTGLMNRESFLSALNDILTRNQRGDNLSALLFIDLDDFKRVNDTLGHDFGDLLLCGVAARLKQSVRTAECEKQYKNAEGREVKNPMLDSVFRPRSRNLNRFDLGRLGGDEFTVFLADILDQEVAVSIANRLLEALERPFDLEGSEIYISFSIGIAIAPKDGDSIQMLLKNADTAMYSAKAKGKNNFQLYDHKMNAQALYRLTLESDLRKAIARNELYLVYQPQINLQTGALVGAEILMRWKHKSKGEISPVEFIPLAEETGQILALGDWLFEISGKDIQQWKEQGQISEGFKLALNVSSLQFNQSNMMDKVKLFFPDTDLNKHIEFELTETVMMESTSANLEKLEGLVAQNITLSIDDFGTGYSSLSYLHRFPADTVKIDRSFISNMENDGQAGIVKAIIAMAHGMGIKVVAEGVENQWQHDFLKEEACDFGQGYFYYKPLSRDDFQQLLQENRIH